MPALAGLSGQSSSTSCSQICSTVQRENHRSSLNRIGIGAGKPEDHGFEINTSLILCVADFFAVNFDRTVLSAAREHMRLDRGE